MEQAVVDLRREHPTKGAHVLAQMLKNRGYEGVPSKSTITAVLRRHGLIDPAESTKRQPYKRFEHDEPNQMWQMDFKGHVACGDERGKTVLEQLTPIFCRYGMPYTMLVDNGSPWGNDLDHPFTPLTAWLIQLGVRVVHSRPYHPQTLGKLERFHRSLKAELLAGRTYTDLARCQAAFDRWRDFYNLERPHHALDLDTPASRYTISQRSFPETLPIVEYDTDDEVRTVDFNGRISFRGRPFGVGKAFSSKQLAVRRAEASDPSRSFRLMASQLASTSRASLAVSSPKTWG